MEKMTLQKSLFDIPYWKIQIVDFQQKKKELVELLESYPEEKTGLQDFYTNRQSNRSGLIEQFASIMSQELGVFAKEIKKDFAIPEVWSVSYAQGDYQTPHNHSSMGLSGILYLDLPNNSPITNFIQPWNDYETDTVLYHSMPIAEGDIIIYPSFVQHFSEPNKTKKIKRVISWDMKTSIEDDSTIKNVPPRSLLMRMTERYQSIHQGNTQRKIKQENGDG